MSVHHGTKFFRFLLVASDDCHGTDLMAALRQEPSIKHDTLRSELMHLDLVHSTDFCLALEELDNIRAG